MTDDSPKVSEVPIPSTPEVPRSRAELPAREGAIGALRFFAWLSLFGGILGGIAVVATAGTREVVIYSSITRTEMNPVGIGLAVALLMQGMFLCALFLVIAGAAEDLAAIRGVTTE